MNLPDPAPEELPRQFRTTHWSVVLAAGRPDSPEAAAALEHLCQAYWYPLYAFVRRRGHTEEDAKDLTQGFFCQLLARRSLQGLDPAHGRFRAFLLASIKHHLANDRDRARTQKRGGGIPTFSIDLQDPETCYAADLADDETPEHLFDRRWAHAVVAQVLSSLRAEQTDPERLRRFEVLHPFLLGEPHGLKYQDTARQLGLTVSAVTSALHRLRIRFREIFRSEIAQTVADPAEVDAEIRYLVQALLSPPPPTQPHPLNTPSRRP